MEKLYRKISILMILAIIDIVAIIMLAYSLSLNADMQRIEDLDRVSYTVKSGDTLWDFARDNCPEGVDLRLYIDKIEEINHCGSNLQVGQKLIILVDNND